jgi:4'-phosphopantetheinyl transferase
MMYKFNITDFEPSIFISTGNFTCLDELRINCFLINIQSNKTLVPQHWDYLDDYEKNRAEKFYFEDDKVRYILSRSILKKLLSCIFKIEIDTITIDYSASKPVIRHLPVQFNISHSGDFVFIGISKAVIGVDIEKINPDFEYKDIINRYFDSNEIETIEQSENQVFKFYKYWTRKEAFLKAWGTGLDFDLESINVSDRNNDAQPDYFIKSALLNNGYYFSFSSDLNLDPLIFNTLPGIFY